MEHVKRNIFLLSMGQFIALSSILTLITYSSLVAKMMTGQTALATIPSAAAIIGAAVIAYPASIFMKKFGRKKGFYFGALCATIGGTLAVVSIYQNNYYLFVFSTFMHGIYQAFSNYYRFTAMEVSPSSFHKQAVSYVLAGGVGAGLCAPTLARIFEENYYEPVQYAGTYCLVIVLSLVAHTLISFIKLPKRAVKEESHEAVQTSTWDIIKRPAFICASLSAGCAYLLMSFIMTATPLEIVLVCGYQVSEAAGVIQWHSMSMFAPAFFTGTLIARYSSINIILTGILIMSVAALIAKAGIELANFYGALILIGIGWNFMFTAGTTLLEHAYNEQEKAKVQGMNDVIVFGLTAVSTIGSGFMLETIGWNNMNNIVLITLGFLLLVIFWYIKTNKDTRKKRDEAVLNVGD